MKKFIYLIKSYGKDEYKIGYSKDIKQRIKNIETSNPNNIDIIHEFESKYPTKLENVLHRQFRSKKIKNEWFNLNDNDVDNFINICEKTEKNFDFLSKTNYHFRKLLKIK